MMKMDDGISKQKGQRIEEKIAQMREGQEMDAVREIIEFNKTPFDLKTDMDRFVIGQENGKKIMCTAIAFHYRRLGQALKIGMTDSGGDIDLALRNTKTPKANILIIGPTGCGKTYTGETASNLVGVPFVHEDMTKFSEVGYVGQNASDILIDLLLAAGGNPNVAQMGIVWERKESICQQNTCCLLPAGLLKISIPWSKNGWPGKVWKAIGDTI
jgi:ATP-dependent Clp protease ATP-binding subunit ClpX